MVNFEDNAADTIIPRLIAVGADLSRVHLWQGVHVGDDTDGDPMYTIGTDTEALTKSLLDVHATLLVVDPLVAALTVDTSKDAHVRRVVGECDPHLKTLSLGRTRLARDPYRHCLGRTRMPFAWMLCGC